MKLLLLGLVSTQAVLPGINTALQSLYSRKKLQHEWGTKIIQTNVESGGIPECGAILFPTRRNSEKVCAFPPSIERRIVLRPLPTRAKVLTPFLEIGYGRGPSNFPLLGTEDAPQKGIRGFFNGDFQYVPDFFAILGALREVLVVAGDMAPSPFQQV